MDKLNTGDIMLFDTRFFWSRWIEYFTQSSYSHVGMILRKPVWLDPKLTDDLYLLESGFEVFPDAETGKVRFGVQISPFQPIYDQYINQGFGLMFWRKFNLQTDQEEFQEKLKQAYFKVEYKHYDLNPSDWLIGLFELNRDIDNDTKLTEEFQKTKSFWCSALVSYLLVQCNLLPNDLPWTLISPRDFSSKSHSRLVFNDCSYDPEISFQ